ncbi:Haloacid dehalogenase-like hydrolase (HAD) superfamily protein [Quillaja saponaria]|uniref:Haloacid dehalogenase-like hydrolase (HAD) superfamily protein n=1 Tax=Quillaja saponaria TaxID=32244 RepID=A0AAD7PGN4_QUISA|nr:Haloacid dehalogenase-like hydrolase (HAD) superfamily protein [Quillaja saponaria]
MDSCSKSIMDASSPFDCLIFDLDDTLYTTSTGIGEALKKNIDVFLVEKFGFPEIKASSLRVELFKTYGSSLAGLRALGHDISADDYHSFVHGRLPYELIKPDPQLRNLLLSISQRKIIFTNSDRIHAVKVLDCLGLNDCFDQIICFETMNPNLDTSTRPDELPVLLKPSMDAMKIALEAANVNPRRTLFLDDNVRNIAAGKAMGLHTVLVGKTVKSKEADYVLEMVKNLGQVIPEIWVSGMNGDDRRIRRSKSELAAILTTTAVVV